jgi:hypothetical protein
MFDHDSYITKESFDVAIGALYGATKLKADIGVNSLNMIAIAQYLDIPHIVCMATDQVVSTMSFKHIRTYTLFATQNNYGSASERIIDSARGFLSLNGWQGGLKVWDGIPSSIIASVLGADCFFVPSEWERAIFIIKLIERRQNRKSSIDDDDFDDDLEPLFDILNSRVYYCHLTAEQLHKLENMTDTEGTPYVDPNVLRDALWQSVQLHKKVATADPKSQELGLTTVSEQPPDNVISWFVPAKDETLYGTPGTLETLIKENHQISESLPSGKTTEKHTNEGISSTTAIDNTNSDPLYKVTKVPPFRFSIAFSGVSELEADKRVYAKTLWYAGSYWNLYIQKIRHRKGYQMGVYIHRASSFAPSRSGLLNRDVLNTSMTQDNDGDDDYELDLENMSMNFCGVSLTDKSTPSQSTESLMNNSLAYTADSVETDTDDSKVENDGSFLSYEDQRAKTSVFYVIYTPSRKFSSTSSLTCFISTPDLFNKSQSWGWKSNSMCSFNEDGTLADDQEKLLKFMVVLGNT